MTRWIRFIIAILIGVAAGLYYAWKVNPVRYIDSTPSSLSMDYKTDYVLMVAEAYHAGSNLELAQARLQALDSGTPVELAHQAILFAERVGYRDLDLSLLQDLYTALQAGLQPGAPPSTLPGETPNP